MRATGRTFVFSIILAIIVGCSSAPDGVLGKNDMADLLVDMNIGECVVEMNFREYNNDSLKKVLRQSILADHGLTSADYDRSIEWYGRNMDKYQDVYDEVIRRLEKRIAEEKLNLSSDDINTTIAQPTPSSAPTQTSFEGDSVDIWTQPRFYIFSSRIASEYVTFSVARDANFRVGDVFTWRLKLANQGQPVKWGLFATYDDNTIDMAVSDGLNIFATNAGESGYQTLVLRTANHKMPNRVFGFIRVRPSGKEQVKIGDITLVRSRYSSAADEVNNSELRQIQEDDGSVTLRFDNNSFSDNDTTVKSQGQNANDNIDPREQRSRLEDERKARQEEMMQHKNERKGTLHEENNHNRHTIDESRISTPIPRNTNQPQNRVNNNQPQSRNGSQPMTRGEAKHYESKNLRRGE